MRHRLSLVTSLAVLLAFGTAASPVAVLADSAHLVILHTTDLHGALTAWDYMTDHPAGRGLVKIAGLVRAARGEGAPVLLVDDGDAIQGGAIESAWWGGDRARPEPMMTAMTRMGYDAMAVGNHEFSWGAEGIARARKDAGFPWLAANVVRADDGAPVFTPSIVKTAGAVRVGILGLVTPAIPALEDSAHWTGLRFLSPAEAARAEVKRLRDDEHCDVVVALAHTGLGSRNGTETGVAPDENWGYRIVSDVPGIDVLILGHTHAIVRGTMENGVLVAQAGRNGENLGRVDVDLERDGAGPWRVTARRSRIVAVADSTPADADLDAFAAPYHEAAEALLSERIGEAGADIRAPEGLCADGPLWDLIHAAQLEATGAVVSLTALPDPAAVIHRGPVTMRDAMRVYPYDNTLAVVQLSGAELKDALERSARAFASYTYEAGRPLLEPGATGGGIDGARGVTYEIDLARAPGDRIVNLFRDGEPLAPDATLAVVVNSYRLQGGGGFEEIARAPRVKLHGPDVRQALVDAIRRAGVLEPATDRSWTVLPDYAGAPERALIDLLVRQGVAPKSEVQRLFPDEPARRADLAYWLARAYGWREKRLSGAFADAPDSLEPWLDGLLKRRVLGSDARQELIRPFTVASLATAEDWCEAAARWSWYALDTDAERGSFRRSLLAGTDLGAGAGRVDTLTRAEVLGLVANTRFPTVRVLETTDFHGAILPVATERRSGRAIGGSAVLAAWIERLRAENPEGTILVDGGDAFQGTMISNLQFGRPVVEQMNRLGYSAIAIGNHDFDWSADTLAARVGEMRFAALGANVLERATGRRPAWVRADTLLVRRGVRIALFGLAYNGTPSVTLASNVAKLRFADDSATAARLVPELRKREKAQVVVEIGHTPAESDSLRHATGGDLPRLAHVPGVDAWFGGHSHNQVVDEVGGEPILIAGSQGQAVGVCDLTVDPVRGRVVERRARLVTTYADEVIPDSAMAARVGFWNSRVAAIAAAPLARGARAIGRGRGESALGDLVTDAMRAAGGADVAFQNSGGLRADLAAGPITRGSVYEVMPFDNTLVTLTMTGAELRRMIVDGLKRNSVPIESGLRIRYDASAPEEQRLQSLTLADGSPLDDARRYKVAVNNFMASGGDNLSVYQNALDKIDTGILIRSALEDWIVAHAKDGVLDYASDGRIERVGAGPNGSGR